MQITLYKNFSKRKNSTKQPTGGTTATVVFKDGCSTENPVFLINGVDLSVNYVGFNSGYYFVDDIVLGNNNIYELHCSIDVLATWKSLIGSYNAFIERAASAYDPMVIDTALSGSQTIKSIDQATTQIQTTSGNIAMNPQSGCYVVKVFGKNNGLGLFVYDDLTVIGALLNNTAFGLTDNDLNNLLETGWMQILDASAYISNVMWFPFPSTVFNKSSVTMDVAYIHLQGVTANKITWPHYIACSGTISLPTNDYTDFRAKHPSYSSYKMYLPGVGTVDLPPMEGYSGLTYSLVVDAVTGAATYYVFSAQGLDRALIGTYEGQLGIEIPFGTVSVTQSNILSNVGGAVVSALATENPMPLIGAGLTAVENAVVPAGSINSGRGSMGKIISHPYIMISIVNYESKQFPTAVAGRPLFESRTISTLSGYVKCGKASIDIPGAAPNKDAVNAYLNSGFYYE